MAKLIDLKKHRKSLKLQYQISGEKKFTGNFKRAISKHWNQTKSVCVCRWHKWGNQLDYLIDDFSLSVMMLVRILWNRKGAVEKVTHIPYGLAIYPTQCNISTSNIQNSSFKSANKQYLLWWPETTSDYWLIHNQPWKSSHKTLYAASQPKYRLIIIKNIFKSSQNEEKTTN